MGTAKTLVQDVATDRADLLVRIQSEFSEMPGLVLTIRQARRLWCLDEPVCEQLLGTLVASGFLYRTPSDAFMLVADSRGSR